MNVDFSDSQTYGMTDVLISYAGCAVEHQRDGNVPADLLQYLKINLRRCRISPMLVPDGHCQRINTRFFHKLRCLGRICIHVVVQRFLIICLSSHMAQFCFHRNAHGMELIHHLPCHPYVLLKAIGRTIYHEGIITDVNGMTHYFKAAPMVPMDGAGERGLSRIGTHHVHKMIDVRVHKKPASK